MRKRVGFVWALVVAVVFAFSWGVSREAAAQGSSVRTLKFTTLYTSAREMFATPQYFVTEIEKRTQGRIKFQIFPGSSLVPTNQFVSSVDKGVLDVAFAVPSYEGGLWPITDMGTVFGAPNVTYEKWRTVHDQVLDIMNKNINLNVVILSMPHVVVYHLCSRKPLTGKASDFKGLLVRGTGTSFDASIRALSGSPVAIPSPESYMALQRGTVDASMVTFDLYFSPKLYEPAPYFMMIPTGCATFGQYFIINKGVWNSLPDDIQKIFIRVGKDVVAFSNDHCAATDQRILNSEFPKHGIKPVIMSEAENRLLLEKLKPAWNEYVTKLGKPAEEIARIIGVR